MHFICIYSTKKLHRVHRVDFKNSLLIVCVVIFYFMCVHGDKGKDSTTDTFNSQAMDHLKTKYERGQGGSRG